MSGGLFGVGSGVNILILLLVLNVLRPERLPQIARIWGQALRFINKFSNTWNQMNTQLMRQIDEETKPVMDALRLDEEPQPKPVVDGESQDDQPQDPDPITNTIAPPELTSDSASAPQPETEETALAPFETPDSVEPIHE